MPKALPKTKAGALAAAKKALGPEAIEGVDFDVRNTGAGWEHVVGAPQPAPTSRTRKASAKAASMPARAAKEAAKPRVVKAKAQRAAKTAVNGGLAQSAVITDPAPHSDTQVLPTLKAPRKAKAKAPAAEPKPKADSKGDVITALLRRPQGADVHELAKASGWQKHSVRGYIAGNLKKKQGILVEATKEGEGDNRRTVYRIAETAEAI